VHGRLAREAWHEGHAGRHVARIAIVAALAAGGGSATVANADPPATLLLPPAWTEIQTGPEGGSVWQGPIPDRFVAGATRPAVVYLPPGASSRRRYPVLYLLHGLPGSPYSFVFGLRLATIADELIAAGHIAPFIGVMPSANTMSLYKGEWTGARADYIVRGVVPWTDAHLPTLARAADRTLAGLSAGGTGAIEIGLTHPRTFGALEAWSGTFAELERRTAWTAPAPPSRRHAVLPLLRIHADRRTAGLTRRFARELDALRLSHELLLEPGGHDGRFWRRQLPRALEFAFDPRL
jgi:enterochelin esterase-like enzyme